jgi:hypothetical protein
LDAACYTSETNQEKEMHHMKLLVLGSLLLSGGGVAMTNETVQEDIGHVYNQVKEAVRQGFKGSMIERVKESGFPYPNEAFLAQLTDEQEALYVTAIDQINAEYDWSSMTDDEIRLALEAIHEELALLRAELGIDVEPIQQRQGRHWNDEFVPKGGGRQGGGQQGDGSYDGTCPYDGVDPDAA